MPVAAIVSGLLLLLVGIAGYSFSDAAHPVTALIPAGWGILLLIPGLIAQTRPALRKHMMHAAAGIALLGALLAGGRLAMVLAKGSGSALGMASLGAMTLICVIFLVLCIRSFRAARQARAQ